VAMAISQAEGTALMRDAVLLFDKATREGGDAVPDAEARWTALDLDAKTARQLKVTLDGLAERSLPALDAEVSDADVQFFNQLAAAATALDRALSPKVLAPEQIRVRRLKRWSVTAGIGLIAVLALYVGLRPLPCKASGFLMEEFRCEMAIDGDVKTEWLSPDLQSSWIEFRVSPRRDIKLVRLTNGHNRTSNDRAIRAYQIEAYSGKHRMNSVSGEFPTLNPAPQPTEIPLQAKDVDRVRVIVPTWHGAGAALAEIKFE
jgi:hypothetical protein